MYEQGPRDYLVLNCVQNTGEKHISFINTCIQGLRVGGEGLLGGPRVPREEDGLGAHTGWRCPPSLPVVETC
jgi:hypothetical protein